MLQKIRYCQHLFALSRVKCTLTCLEVDKIHEDTFLLKSSIKIPHNFDSRLAIRKWEFKL